MSEYILFDEHDDDLYKCPLYVKIPTNLPDFDMPKTLDGIDCKVVAMGPSFKAATWDVKLLLKSQSCVEDAVDRIQAKINKINSAT